MTKHDSDIAFTAPVRAAQERLGSRAAMQRLSEKCEWPTSITPELAAFVEAQDSLYMATTGPDGHPYIQHRGGPKGFLKPLDNKRFAFADFSGNKQYISIRHRSENPKAFIFLMDYRDRRRIKIWGQAQVVEDDPDLLASVRDADYPEGPPERVIVFEVEAWDINCQQHITPRFSADEVVPIIEGLKARNAELSDWG